MKALKIIGIVLGALILIIIVAGLIIPKEFNTERSIVINAPKEVVWDHVSTHHKTHEWSPWAEKDPEMEATFEGEDGAIGSKMSWEGNDDVGSGWQTIKAVEPMKRVEQDLHFIKPWEGDALAYIDLTEVEGGTEVKWGFESEMKFPMNILGKIMGMGELNKDLEHGLETLKAKAEKSSAERLAMADVKAKQNIAIIEQEQPERIYVMHREKIGWDKMHDFFSTHLGAIFGLIEKNKMEMTGSPSGIYFEWDEANQMADMAAAIPVKAAKGDLGMYKTFTAPKGMYMVVDYYGAYEGVGDAHYAIDDYIKAKSYKESNVVIEEYVTDPETEADTSKWLTKVYYNIVK